MTGEDIRLTWPELLRLVDAFVGGFALLRVGYDHRNHFHFDIKQRRNNYVACR